MRTQRDYYEILGLSRTASIDEVKKRYRELARKFHPDVVGNTPAGQRAFVQMTTAYKTLVDPDKRAEYDSTLTANDPSGGSSGYQYPSSPEVEALLKKAEMAYTIGQHIEAAEFCKQALDIERANPKTHALLGSIYQAQGKIGPAISEFSYAVQYNPTDTESKMKLEKLRKQDPAKVKRQRSHKPQGSSEGTSLLGKIKTLFQK